MIPLTAIQVLRIEAYSVDSGYSRDLFTHQKAQGCTWRDLSIPLVGSLIQCLHYLSKDGCMLH